MKTSWLIGLFVLFVVLHLITGVMEMSYMGAREVSRLQVLMQPGVIFSNWLPWAIVTAAATYIANFFNMLMFNYPTIFQGPYLIVKYALFIPISLGILVTLVLGVIGTVRSMV